MDFRTFQQYANPDTYLTMPELTDGHCYQIWARNAYVGVWQADEQGFLISRYKVGPNPYLFTEFHWDIGTALGTAKPLAPIGPFPFALKDEREYTAEEAREVLTYLDALEQANPMIPGWDSLAERRDAAIRFGSRLAGYKPRNPRITTFGEFVTPSIAHTESW